MTSPLDTQGVNPNIDAWTRGLEFRQIDDTDIPVIGALLSWYRRATPEFRPGRLYPKTPTPSFEFPTPTRPVEGPDW